MGCGDDAARAAVEVDHAVIIASRKLCTTPAWRLPARASVGGSCGSKRVGTMALWSG
jgi:hypothetical protein